MANAPGKQDPTSLNTVAGQWKTFQSVINPSAPAIQRQEMCLAFYAGAEGALRILAHISGPDVSEEAGAALLQSLRDECQAFAREYGKGKGLPAGLIDIIAPAERRGASA